MRKLACRRAGAAASAPLVARSARRVATPAEKPQGRRPATARCIIGVVPEAVLDHRRGDREGRRHDSVPVRHSAPDDASSRDRKRFYTVEAAMEKVEILDIASRKTIDTFTLSEGNKKVRIRSLEPDPLHRFVIMVTASATKLIDRFEIGAPTLVQYDLKEHKIVRTIPWPNGEERQNANILFSPDGKLMYLFSDQDVLIYETDDVHAGGQVGAVAADRGGLRPPRVRLARRPERRARLLHVALQRLGSGAAPPHDGHRPRQPRGQERGLLHAGPVDRRSASRWRPAARRAYGLFEDIGRYEFWKFDLEHRKFAGRTEFKGRPRMGAEDQLERQGALHLRRRQHDRSVRRRDLPVPADDHARRRHDDRSVRPAAEA